MSASSGYGENQLWKTRPREQHICPQTITSPTPTHALSADLENYQVKTLEMGRQKSSREAIALTSLLDVSFLGITLLWLWFPGHARLAQIPSELQGWVFQDMPALLRYPLNCKAGTYKMCHGPGCALCSAPFGGMSLRKATYLFVFLWVHLPNIHVCFRLSGHNIFDLRGRHGYQK